MTLFVSKRNIKKSDAFASKKIGIPLDLKNLETTQVTQLFRKPFLYSHIKIRVLYCNVFIDIEITSVSSQLIMHTH